MKKISTKLTLIIFSALFFWNCDTSSSTQPDQTTPNMDQPLTGKISGSEWSFVSGRVRLQPSSEWFFELYDVEPSTGFEPWDSLAYSLTGPSSKIAFEIPSENLIGRHELFYNISLENFTATLTDSAGGIFMAKSGYIQITELDSEEKLIRGEMHIWVGEDRQSHEIYGSFEIPVRPSDL